MDWYSLAYNWYKSGLWTSQQVQDAVTMGKITQDQANTILSI